MKYLMVTKWDNVFVDKGEFSTEYLTKYIKITTISEKVETIFINTKHKIIYNGSFIRVKNRNQQKVEFNVMLTNKLSFNNIYGSKASGWFLISDEEYNRFINPASNVISQMVYITKANSKQISFNIDPIKFKELEGEIYKSKIKFFNKHEENSILAIKEFFTNPERFIKELYRKIERKDTFKFIWEGGCPAYHIDLNCEQLRKDYENFEIPEDIQAKGINEVKKFRVWFEENRYLLDKPDVFVMRLHLAFGIITNPAAINIQNSGQMIHLNFELSELEKIIDELLIESDKYSSKNEMNKKILSMYGKLAFLYKRQVPEDTGYSQEDVYSILKEYDTIFKQPVYKYLIEYHKIKFNPELKVEGQLLDQIGFKQCGTCYKKQ